MGWLRLVGSLKLYVSFAKEKGGEKVRRSYHGGGAESKVKKETGREQ